MAGNNSSDHHRIPLLRSDRIETRLYQESIAERILERNTLVVLPTALGKTVIAALACASSLYNFKHKRVLVMAPTRPLVLQHHETYTRLLKLRATDMVTLTGKTPAVYRKLVWNGTTKIVFATPQIVKNDIENKILTLRDFSLLVFDECHRARKDYAYTNVAQKYVEQSSWPIILGMTASPGADREKIIDICKALFIEQIEYRSEEDHGVIPYIFEVEVERRLVDLPNEYREIGRTIRAMLGDRLNQLSRTGLIRTGTERVSRKDLLALGEQLRDRLGRTIKEWRGPIYNSIVIQSACLTLYHALELLETQGIQTLKSFLERIEQPTESKRSHGNIINDMRYQELKRLVEEHSKLEHPKIPLMKEIVEEQIHQCPESKVLIFTQYRDTASYIVDRLRDVVGVKAQRFVGQATKDGDPGLRQDEQVEIIENYREGNTNVLVATCIAEEGLDIPNVDLVIFYEPIPSEIRYIQRKGRTGRKAAGKAVILAANDTFDIAYLHASRRRIEKMRRIIESLNVELAPLARIGPEPQPMRMSADDIRELEEGITSSNEQTTAEPEKHAKEFLKEVDKTSRYVWKKVMKTDVEGLQVDQLLQEAMKEGITSAVIDAAIERLEEAGKVARIDNDRIVTITNMSMGEPPVAANDGLYEVLVEDISPGKAVVLIDGKQRARLTEQDFEGPQNLIKKKSRFKARGAFYHCDGTLHFRVIEVVQQL